VSIFVDNIPRNNESRLSWMW